MRTIHEARFALDRRLLECHAAGLPAHVEQVDVVECEDGATAMAYVYLHGAPDEPLVISFDLPAPFDHRACAEALLRGAEETVH